jgi:hypothetical protein
VLGYWSVGVLECWSVGVLECWSVGVLECWSVGVLEMNWTLTVAVLADCLRRFTAVLSFFPCRPGALGRLEQPTEFFLLRLTGNIRFSDRT